MSLDIFRLPVAGVHGTIGTVFPSVCHQLGDKMPKSYVVSASENDTGEGLLSEVLSIPMLIRGEPSTSLMTKSDFSKSFGFPTILRSKPFSGLTSGGPIFGFLPLLSGRK